MSEPPQEIDGARVGKYATVTDLALPTGATRHVVYGAEMGPAEALAIARYPSGEGVYLFYLGADGEAVTDTWHESVEGALDQAAFEYVGLVWSDVSP